MIMSIKKLLPIIGIIILLYILSTMDIGKIISIFSKLNPWYVTASFCSILPIVLIANYQWQFILKKHKIQVSFWYSLKNIFIGFFYGFITPGGLGGYTRAIYLKKESGETLQKCFVNILILNTIDYLTLLSIGVIGGFVLSSKFPNIFPFILILFIIMISLAVFFIHKETGAQFFKKLLQSKLFNPFKEKWTAHIDTIYKDIPTFSDLLIPFSISILSWLLYLSEFYIISKLFAIDVPYIYFILIVAVANIIASLPITIYGLGTREIVLIGLLSGFAVAPESIVSLSLFWFVLVWLFPSIIGAGVTMIENRRIDRSDSKTMV